MSARQQKSGDECRFQRGSPVSLSTRRRFSFHRRSIWPGLRLLRNYLLSQRPSDKADRAKAIKLWHPWPVRFRTSRREAHKANTSFHYGHVSATDIVDFPFCWSPAPLGDLHRGVLICAWIEKPRSPQKIPMSGIAAVTVRPSTDVVEQLSPLDQNKAQQRYSRTEPATLLPAATNATVEQRRIAEADVLSWRLFLGTGPVSSLDDQLLPRICQH